MASTSYLFMFMLMRLLFLLHTFHPVMVTKSYSSAQPLCHNNEHAALIQFKQSLSLRENASGDPFAYPKVASWKLGRDADCCTWDGVKCDQDTGHVIGLVLNSSFLYGSIDSNSSLFNLVHLQTLNLADNDFNYSRIPSEIIRFSMLSTLNLSLSVFCGQIPSEISGLSRLVSLDLSGNTDFTYSSRFLKLEKPGLRGLVQNLTYLKELFLSEVDISSQVPENLGNLTSLRSLRLKNCGLYGEFPTAIFHLPNLEILSAGVNENLTGSLPEFHQNSPLKILVLRGTNFSGVLPYSIGNLSSLSVLRLSDCHFSSYLPASLNNLTLLTYLGLSTNQFSGPIPILESLSQLTTLSLSSNKLDGGDLFWLGKLTKLTELDLGLANLSGEIPSSLANLTELAQIDLGDNQLAGEIPSWLTNMTQAIYIDLSDNEFQGQIPSSFRQLKNIDFLSLTSNKLSGTVEADIFLSLRKLTQLQLSGNRITLLHNNKTNDTLPRFSLLLLDQCNITEFPHFLRFQDELEALTLTDNKIRGKIPEWVSNISKETLQTIDFGYNMLEGFEKLPEVLPWVNLGSLYLSYNMLRGPLPVPSLKIFDYQVSSNSLIGEIPSSFCEMSDVQTLDFSNNNMHGTIPPCLGNLSSLVVLDLKGNKFSGNILQTYKEGNNLRMIDLSQNLLVGQIPRSLASCTNLEILDFGDNQIEDTFPFWLGALPRLRILVLRSNRFHGAVEGPIMNEDFPELRVIDLSNNGFSGNLPLGWNAMKISYVDQLAYLKANITTLMQERTWDLSFDYTMTITTKSVKTNYEKILNVFIVIDLSSNKFKGEIPYSIGSLKGLHSLNLSNNDLIGPIPPSLGQLSYLESLDLSRNRLSGEIPAQLVLLNFLAVLFMSYNNLSGPVPKGKQFDTFQNDSYVGNLALCGEPLSRRCGDRGTTPPLTIEQGDDFEFLSGVDWVVICLGIGSGLVVGLISGRILATRNHEWLVEKFGMKKANGRRQRKMGQRS
ncbi:hypothetical protein LguiB_005831 [Lonicera macranthoides]